MASPEQSSGWAIVIIFCPLAMLPYCLAYLNEAWELGVFFQSNIRIPFRMYCWPAREWNINLSRGLKIGISYTHHFPSESPYDYALKILKNSSLKPLDQQFESTFLWRLLEKVGGGEEWGEQKFCSNDSGPSIKIATEPTYGKNT